MDTQTVGTAEPGPTFVGEVEQLGEKIKTDVETIADRILGTGAGAKIETVAVDAVGKAASEADAAVAAIKAIGAGHVNLTQISLTSELATAKAQVEDVLVALARHLAGL